MLRDSRKKTTRHLQVFWSLLSFSSLQQNDAISCLTGEVVYNKTAQGNYFFLMTEKGWHGMVMSIATPNLYSANDFSFPPFLHSLLAAFDQKLKQLEMQVCGVSIHFA